MGSSNKEVENLICGKIGSRGSYECTLASYVWEEADKIVSGGPQGGWDGVGFCVDVRTGRLWMDCSKYPNQFGYAPSEEITISAEQFHDYAVRNGMSSALQRMRNQNDWDNVLNSKAVKDKIAEIQKKDEIKRKESEEAFAIKVPRDSLEGEPSMDYSVRIYLQQRYGSSSVSLASTGNEYRLQTSTKERILNRDETVWIENEIKKVLANGSRTTWQSLPGGDSMIISIYKGDVKRESIDGGKPLKKYVDFMFLLEKLVDYGSRIIDDAEKDKDADDKTSAKKAHTSNATNTQKTAELELDQVKAEAKELVKEKAVETVEVESAELVKAEPVETVEAESEELIKAEPKEQVTETSIERENEAKKEQPEIPEENKGKAGKTKRTLLAIIWIILMIAGMVMLTIMPPVGVAIESFTLFWMIFVAIRSIIKKLKN